MRRYLWHCFVWGSLSVGTLEFLYRVVVFDVVLAGILALGVVWSLQAVYHISYGLIAWRRRRRLAS